MSSVKGSNCGVMMNTKLLLLFLAFIALTIIETSCSKAKNENRIKYWKKSRIPKSDLKLKTNNFKEHGSKNVPTEVQIAKPHLVATKHHKSGTRPFDNKSKHKRVYCRLRRPKNVNKPKIPWRPTVNIDRKNPDWHAYKNKRNFILLNNGKKIRYYNGKIPIIDRYRRDKSFYYYTRGVKRYTRGPIRYTRASKRPTTQKTMTQKPEATSRLTFMKRNIYTGEITFIDSLEGQGLDECARAFLEHRKLPHCQSGRAKISNEPLPPRREFDKIINYYVGKGNDREKMIDLVKKSWQETEVYNARPYRQRFRKILN